MANHNKGIVADAKCLTKKLLKKNEQENLQNRREMPGIWFV